MADAGAIRPKIGQTYLCVCLLLLGHGYCIFLEIIGLKAPGNYSASIWSYNFSICLWENPKTLISMISGVLGRVPETQHQLFLSLETSGYPKNQEESPGIFPN